jgi:hypothetical protein
MDCEVEEKAVVYSDDEVGFDDDPFLAEGLSSDSELNNAGDVAQGGQLACMLPNLTARVLNGSYFRRR